METKAEAAGGRAEAEMQATNDRRDKEGITLGRITLIDQAEALNAVGNDDKRCKGLTPATTHADWHNRAYSQPDQGCRFDRR